MKRKDLSMKFYSEKLSPRRLSLQWRLTLLISGLVITACALMYFFISRSAVTGLEGISDYVVLVTPDNSNPISINVDPKISSLIWKTRSRIPKTTFCSRA